MDILYVDDENSNLKIFETTFKHNFKIKTVISGEEALEILEREHFKVIVSDQRMPEMTGVEFLKIVAKKYPNSVKILMTGFSDLSTVIDAINICHIYKYVPKPWNKASLKPILDEAIQKFQETITQQKHLADLESKLKDLNKSS